MIQEEFTKLFIYMEKRFDKIEAELAKKADAERMYASFDTLAKRIENIEHELAMQGTNLPAMQVGCRRLLNILIHHYPRLKRGR